MTSTAGNMRKIDLLRQLRFGERIAEEEADRLETYFVETNQWHEIFNGEKDLIFGPKGAGKSALYALLRKRSDQLEAKKIRVVLAENPVGATVFKGLTLDPPPTEIAFIALWKLYCLVLLAQIIRERSRLSKPSKALLEAMTAGNLLPDRLTRETIFDRVSKSIQRWFDSRVTSVEGGLGIDPNTGIPMFTGKVSFDDANVDQRDSQLPIEDFLTIADQALGATGFEVWILFDRLDVAFAENPELERNALRALFRTYRDLRRLDNVRLKIFVRDDIWHRVTEGGFAEASHYVRQSTIHWDEGGLRDLVVRRLVNNQVLCDYLGLSPDAVTATAEAQSALLDRILPDKVDVGRNPRTFNWMIARVSDASNQTTPREMIHLLDEVRRLQIAKLERGETEPPGDQLFDRTTFKEALREVSKVRYEQTFRAENPGMVKYTEALREKRSEQTIDSLAEIWECGLAEAEEVADKLSDHGFFERRGARDGRSYWVPFIYRDALDLVQGRAE